MIELYEKHRLLSLSNFKGKYLVCPACGKLRLKPYAYTDGSIESETLGRCQREANCGYHLKPADYFKNKGEDFHNRVTFKPPTPKEMYILDPKICTPVIANYRTSTLFQLLQQTGIDYTAIFERYKIGSTKHGSTIFFQFDGANFRTGKKIKYLENGHRDKSVMPPVGWLHKIQPDFDETKQELRQCFFGRHLLSDSETVCIVESEKTAIVCAGIFKNAVWMATGGRTQLSGVRLSELSQKKVLLFPDSDSVDFWTDKVKAFGNCKVVDLKAFNVREKEGADIADYLLEGTDKIRGELFKKLVSILK